MGVWIQGYIVLLMEDHHNELASCKLGERIQPGIPIGVYPKDLDIPKTCNHRKTVPFHLGIRRLPKESLSYCLKH